MTDTLIASQLKNPEKLHRLLVQTYESYLRADQRACLATLENLHDKYAVTAGRISRSGGMQRRRS